MAARTLRYVHDTASHAAYWIRPGKTGGVAKLDPILRRGKVRYAGAEKTGGLAISRDLAGRNRASVLEMAYYEASRHEAGAQDIA